MQYYTLNIKTHNSIHTYPHTYSCTPHAHIHTDTYVSTYVQYTAHEYTGTHTHTYIHTYTHTDIYTHTVHYTKQTHIPTLTVSRKEALTKCIQFSHYNIYHNKISQHNNLTNIHCTSSHNNCLVELDWPAISTF